MEVSGYLANQKRGIGDWASLGGAVTLSAGTVVTEAKSTINLAGGYLSYQGGETPRSVLLGADGKTYTPNTAPANMQMSPGGLSYGETHPRWGKTYDSTFSSPFGAGKSSAYEAGYVVQRDGGALIVSAQSAVLNGEVAAQGGAQGVYQTKAHPTPTDATTKAPAPLDPYALGQLAYNASQAASKNNAALGVPLDQAPTTSPDAYSLSQSVVARAGGLFLAPAQAAVNSAAAAYDLGVGPTLLNAALNLTPGGATPPPAAQDLPTALTGVITLDPNVLSDGGLGALSVKTLQAATLTGALNLSPGGALQILAGGVTLDGTLTAPSGSISLSGLAYDGQTYNYGPVAIKAGAKIDTRGLVTNQLIDPSLTGGPAYINGGPVNLKGAGLSLAKGSAMDASAGAFISSTGAFKGGNGGDITLVNDEEGVVTDANGVQHLVGLPQPFLFDASVRSQGFGKGGALTITGAGSLFISDGDSDAAKLVDKIHNTGVLPGGSAAPITLSLDQDLVLHAGDIMPFTWSTKDLPPLPVGVPLTAPVAFIGPVTLGADLTVTDAFLSAYDSATRTITPVFVDNLGNIYGVIPVLGRVLNSVIPKGTTLVGGLPNAQTQSVSLVLPAGFIIPPGLIRQGAPRSLNAQSSSFSGNLQYGINTANVGYVSGPHIANGTTWAQGSILTTDVVIPKGTLIPAGTVFNQNIKVGAVNRLAPGFFNAGFSAYNLGSDAGVAVAPGTRVEVTQPLLTAPANLALVNGPIGSGALTASLSDLYTLNTKSGAISQRAGANLSLSAVTRPTNSGQFINPDNGNPEGSYGTGSIGPLNDATITIGQGAVITVDPGRSISLQAQGQQTIDGSLIAHGGAISITDPYQTQPYVLGAGAPSLSIWLGSKARLDASGQAVTLLSPNGSPVVVQSALSGGTVTLGTATPIKGQFASWAGDARPSVELPTVITRQGSVIDVSGAAATGAATLSGASRTWAGDAGSVTFASNVGIVLGGQINAFAGGEGALGGALVIRQNATGLGTSFVELDGSDHVFGFKPLDSVIQFDQSVTAAQLSGDLTPDGFTPKTDVGTTELSVDGISHSGFTRLSFTSSDDILFKGNVNLSAAQSLVLSSGAMGDTDPNGHVNITAPYVRLGGAQSAVTAPATDAQVQSRFSVKAGLLDLQNAVQFGKQLYTYFDPIENFNRLPVVAFSGFGVVDLSSATDIRFIGATLNTPVDLSLIAERVYATGGRDAATNNSGTAIVGGILSIKRIDDTTPVAPLTYGGGLALYATAIYDDGVIWQPFGAITFNGPTFLGKHSLTSVSGLGLTAPFGGTSDGATYRSPLAGDLSSGQTVSPTFLGQYVAPNGDVTGFTPTISFGGASVSVDKGATLDLRGGGQLLGEGFVRGKGGSVDVLNNAYPINPSTGAILTGNSGAPQVYALVPGAQAPASPISPATQAKGADPLAYSTVTIPQGVPGLPAGTYTLLPGDYALAPGAYRVQIGAPVASGQAGGVAALTDGSYQISGTLGYVGVSAVKSAPVSLILSSATVTASHAQYNRERPANTFLNAA